MKKVLVFIAAGLIWLYAGEYAHAAFKISKFTEIMESGSERDKQSMKLYLYGMGKGFEWANSYLNVKKQKRIFCQPSKFTTDSGFFMKTITNYLFSLEEKNLLETVKKKFQLIEPVLLMALRDRFPC